MPRYLVIFQDETGRPVRQARVVASDERSAVELAQGQMEDEDWQQVCITSLPKRSRRHRQPQPDWRRSGTKVVHLPHLGFPRGGRIW